MAHRREFHTWHYNAIAVEPTAVFVLLNGHAVKQLFKYSCFYTQICASQRSFFLQQKLVNAETRKSDESKC